jgi:hypothetical protein
MPVLASKQQKTSPAKASARSVASGGRRAKEGAQVSGGAKPPVGQPLDNATRRFMESHFQHDFSRVRVHTDEAAHESNRHKISVAYTSGKDIFFARSQYDPSTREGQRLLSHELAHVVQQQPGPSSRQRPLTPALAEAQADLAANRLDSRRPVPSLGRVNAITTQMQSRSTTAISPRREAQLRNLARFPFNFSGLPGRPTWRSLSEGERSVVILAMDELYDQEFTNRFVHFAEAGQIRGVFVGRAARAAGGLDPAELLRRGWRPAREVPIAAGTPQTHETWVHPSGAYLALSPDPGSATEPEFSEEEAEDVGPPERDTEPIPQSEPGVDESDGGRGEGSPFTLREPLTRRPRRHPPRLEIGRGLRPLEDLGL